MHIQRLVSSAAVAVVVLFTGAAFGDPLKIPLKIAPADTARDNTPITATLALTPEQLKGMGEIKSATVAGTRAQLERAGDNTLVVRWVEPHADASKPTERELIVNGEPASAGGSDAPSFYFTDNPGSRDLFFGTQPVYRHMTAFDPADLENTNKPFHHVYGFHNEGFITKGPGGSETHHRGIFLGWGTPSGSFWHCKEVTQRHEKYLDDRAFAGPVAARNSSITNWVDKDGKGVVRDTREITTWHIADDQIAMDWDITVESLSGDIPLSNNAHHAGFHFRALQEVTGGQNSLRKGLATYIRPESAKLLKDDEWADCPWAAMSFPVKDHTYMVMQMNHPDNPPPVTYSTRPYGRFGAFHLQTLKQGEPMRLRYRIVVMDGDKQKDATAATLAANYADYVSPPKVTLEAK